MRAAALQGRPHTGTRRVLAAVVGVSLFLAACAAPEPVSSPAAAANSTPDAPNPAPSPLDVPEPTGWLAAASGSGGQLVLLGDSFAAGEGAGEYRPAVEGARDSCHRSVHPVGAELVAPRNLANLACSRATTGHLQSAQRLGVTDPVHDAATVPAQLEQLRGTNPTLVILSLGGNNLDFSGLLQACLLETQPCDEDPQLQGEAAAQLSTLQPVLVSAYQSVAATVSAPILVLPYPQLFDAADGGCGRLDPGEQEFARHLITELNSVIRLAVDSSAAANIYYVADVEDSLAGHGACSEVPYVHSANVSGLLEAAGSRAADQELLHPTRDGYRAMTRDVVQWAAGHPVAATP